VREEFNLSALDNSMAPLVSIRLSVSCEKGNEATSLLPLRLSAVRDVFNLSASDNSMAPSLPIPFPVLSEKKEATRVTSNVERCKRSI
jgi:hypothetical protein